MKNRIPPFALMPVLAGVSPLNSEEVIRQAMANQPVRLFVNPLRSSVIDTSRMFAGRPVMRERRVVKIEEIGDEL